MYTSFLNNIENLNLGWRKRSKKDYYQLRKLEIKLLLIRTLYACMKDKFSEQMGF